ncbi:YdcF family protein [Shewanella sp. Isolate11]|uniref:YdcF family protein n=1 Tax=Shewanella sp. Isolate11 TaxID=2908530 RepID=UPI001EFE54CF|nr:YdcF family protein [Shewanella sp. Isolate11]MCG9698307.1 YdcF family protein [Shewanella sp. Isolate11]
MFWLKKIISQLFMPLPLTLLLLVIVLLLIRDQQRLRLLLGLAIGLLLVLSSQWGSQAIGLSLEEQYSPNNRAMNSPCVVMVLGSGHDSTVSTYPTQQLSATALARLTEGLRQLRLVQGFGLGLGHEASHGLAQECQLVVSGWGGSDALSHAEVMAAAAGELGVDPSKIIQFPEAKDTLEEALLLRQVIGDAPFRLVTSATHMPRAMMIFTYLRMHPEAAPGDFIARNGYWWKLDARNLLVSQRAIHEYVGMLWLKIKFTLSGDYVSGDVSDVVGRHSTQQS